MSAMDGDDEDDSQDEMRAAVWNIISDDSDDAQEDSDTGEEDDVDGEDDEEQDSSDDDDDEMEEEAKALEEGALRARPSSDLEDPEASCPICLNSFTVQPVATPEGCEHYFCLDCILAWSKKANSCPVDRMLFSNIYLRRSHGGKVQKVITVTEGQEDAALRPDPEQTACEVCGVGNHGDRLLLCDGCDAGFHMECLAPPLHTVPVEEWFCPECRANHRHPTASGATRAIARTLQSERVRGSINRHRITLARATRMTPRYLMQSTWLEETVNAVSTGLNTAVYVKDLTPRDASDRPHRTAKRKKRRKKTVKRGKGKSASTGVRRRRRKVRGKRKSRKRAPVKKLRSIGVGKPRKRSSLPTMYRTSSLSLFGSVFDLDPVDGEEDQSDSLLEAKRRGISHSALLSHQPVAQPVIAGLPRRAVGGPLSQASLEPTPTADLLGSILTGQSVLLMDGSDVVINRDGSLKATKPVGLSLSLNAGTSSSTSTRVNPGINPLGPSQRSLDKSSSSQSSPHLSPFPHSLSSLQSSHIHPTTRAQPWQKGPSSYKPSPSPGRGHRGANRVDGPHGSHRRTTSSSTPDARHRSLHMAVPLSQPKKTAAKPVWIDVSVLPRIPKIKRESNFVPF